ncbi:MAG: acyl-CoA thioesterase [Gemmatimonadaceae bacterium]|jgi:acyl-CoA thioester hydrolase|nr:acyl-CoA thioesterase [Gemmatimonadaceae bacterium]
MASPLTGITELRVRYAETDQMGVVYHANYLAWCEVGRTEFIRERGLTYATLERQGTGLAVMDASLRFHAPARYDDLVRVTTTLAEVRSRAIRFDYLITHAERGTKFVAASTTLVGVDGEGRVTSLPPALRTLLERVA